MKSLRDPKRRPTHPGAILREDVLPALKMTQAEFAQRLGVSRLSVSDLLHEKRAMSPEMSARVAKLLNTTPESWLRMQEAATCGKWGKSRRNWQASSLSSRNCGPHRHQFAPIILLHLDQTLAAWRPAKHIRFTPASGPTAPRSAAPDSGTQSALRARREGTGAAPDRPRPAFAPACLRRRPRRRQSHTGSRPL